MDIWWLPLGIKDVIDIGLLAMFFYISFNVLRNSGSRALFTGLMTFFVMWIIVSQVLDMKLMGALLDQFASIGTLALVIIFQDEVKQFLVAIGSARKWEKFKRFFKDGKEGDKELKYVAPIILACMNMAKKKTGALIVVQNETDLSPWMYAGERFEAEINARLIENIFFKNSPMHDGAMIIARGKIQAAGCILPVANTADLNKDLGLRHRAALGISEKTDALVIIISEERGTISLAQAGEVVVGVTNEVLQERLSAIY